MDFQYVEEPEYPFFNDLKKCIVQFVNLSVALLITFILVRLIGLRFITSQNSVPPDLGKVIRISLWYDLIFFVKILPLIFIPFLLVYFNIKNKNIIFLIFGIFSTIVIFIDLALIKFYATALVSLGANLFGYSLSDIIQTIGANITIDAATIMLFLLPVISFWIILYFLRYRRFIGARISVAVLLTCAVVLYNGVSAIPDNTAFQTGYSYNLSINKLAFFAEESWHYFTDDEPVVDIYENNYYED